jgi:hypothetical protein
MLQAADINRISGARATNLTSLNYNTQPKLADDASFSNKIALFAAILAKWLGARPT